MPAEPTTTKHAADSTLCGPADAPPPQQTAAHSAAPAAPAGKAMPPGTADAQVLQHALTARLSFDQLSRLLPHHSGEDPAAGTAAWLSRTASTCTHPGVIAFTASWPLPPDPGPPTAWAWWIGLQQYLRYLTACTTSTAAPPPPA
ncbi:hypothetical protein [Streptomyces sp. NPDC126514]|uniref:hypothetical protein n=1 Tax=Streptomyces sp. NPDC126514 TaxID=3155210 RepID=UPI00332C5987